MKRSTRQNGTKRLLISLDPEQFIKLEIEAALKKMSLQNYIVEIISIDIIRKEWHREEKEKTILSNNLRTLVK